MKLYARASSGFALIEIIIAAAIISASVFSLLSVGQKSVELSRRALAKVQASFLLEEGAEAVKIVRSDGWETVEAFADNTLYYPTFSSSIWSLSATPNTVGNFTRTVTFESAYRDANDDLAESGTADAGTRKATVSVSWPESGGTEEESLVFYIADIFSE